MMMFQKFLKFQHRFANTYLKGEYGPLSIIERILDQPF